MRLGVSIGLFQSLVTPQPPQPPGSTQLFSNDSGTLEYLADDAHVKFYHTADIPIPLPYFSNNAFTNKYFSDDLLTDSYQSGD